MGERLRVQIMLPVLLVCLAVPLNLKLGGLLTVYTFDIALALMYGVWLVHVIRGTGPRPRLGTVDAAALAMLGWFAVSTFLGINRLASVDRTLYYFRSYLIYLYVANNLRTPKGARYFVNLLLMVIVIEGVVGMIQYLTKSDFGSIPQMVGTSVHRMREAWIGGFEGAGLLFRSRGTLGYDTTLARWFELLLPIPISLWFWSRERRQRAAYVCLTAVGFVGLILTFTRGEWMGFAVAVGVLCLLVWRKVGLSREHWLALGGVALLLAGLLGVFREPILVRLWPPGPDNSVLFRARYNAFAAKLVCLKPTAGVGPGNFTEGANRFLEGSLGQEYVTRRVHNVYLLVASEAGLPGLGLFLVLLWVAAITFYRVQEGGWAFGAAVGRALFAGFCGGLVTDIIGWSLLNYQVFPLFWALLGLATAMRRLPVEVDASE